MEEEKTLTLKSLEKQMKEKIKELERRIAILEKALRR